MNLAIAPEVAFPINWRNSAAAGNIVETDVLLGFNSFCGLTERTMIEVGAGAAFSTGAACLDSEFKLSFGTVDPRSDPTGGAGCGSGLSAAWLPADFAEP
jgi:hypothetical protein